MYRFSTMNINVATINKQNTAELTALWYKFENNEFHITMPPSTKKTIRKTVSVRFEGFFLIKLDGFRNRAPTPIPIKENSKNFPNGSAGKS